MSKRIDDGDSRGSPVPTPGDEHFGRRLEALLDEAEASGDYVDVSREDFDAMECEALRPRSARRRRWLGSYGRCSSLSGRDVGGRGHDPH